MNTKLLTIGQVAYQLGISVDWLRKAEKLGRIPRARRLMGGWRAYTQEDLRILEELLAPKAAEGNP